MTKTAKNKEVLDQLYSMVVKQAGAPKPVATGVPGKDPTSEAVSAKHDTVDQNAVKPETLAPQHHEQKPSTDPAKPAASAKKAEEAEVAPKVEANVSVEKLGNEILALVQKFANNPVATGLPGKEPLSESVSTKHDTVGQNEVKPETNPQGFHQKPAKDPSTPVAVAKSAEDEKVTADKVASYELGKLWAEMVLKKAQEEQLEQVKEAGRRDFEMLISQAAAQMKQAAQPTQEKIASVVNNVALEKKAEADGAAAFQSLYKQAQVEQAVQQLIDQNTALNAKIAEYNQYLVQKEAEHQKVLTAKQAELDRITADEREQQKFAGLAALIEERIVGRLQREVATKS